MSEPYEYSFQDQLIFSTGVSVNSAISDILMSAIPGAQRVTKALQGDDRTGVDWWVETRTNDRRLAVDCKIRGTDPIPAYKKDDVALETWSVVESNVIGWSLDDKKRADYILWVWKDTGRWCIAPFLLLTKAFKSKKEEWVSQYRVERQWTRGPVCYHSECVFVDRAVLWGEMQKQSQGYHLDLQPQPRNKPYTIFENLGARR